MPTVLRGDRRIHYVQAGDGPGLVLVPGIGAGARLFGTLPRRFARAGFTCAAVDPVGLPPSGPLTGQYAFADAAQDVLAVAALLPAPVTLAGTSLGGKVALHAAVAQPHQVARLVLLCSAAVASARAKRLYRWFELLATAVDGALLGELLAPFLFGATFHLRQPTVVADIVAALKPTPESRLLMASQARALLTFDGATLLPRCHTPVLCLAGGEDLLTPPAEVLATSQRLSRGRYSLIEHAGHSLLLESAAAYAQLVAFASVVD